MNPKLKWLVIGLAVIIVALIAVIVLVPAPGTPPVAENGVVQPAVSPDGRVTVGAPLAGDLVASPLRIAGNVTGGGWFF